MEDKIKIEKPKLLVAEGIDEKNFFEKLLEYNSIENIQVLPIGGKTQLRDNLKALTYVSNFGTVTSLGITRDADSDHAGAFQSVCDALRNAGLAVPNNQLTLTEGIPKTAVLILPRPNTNGMLEDVCLESIRDVSEMECIQKYFECIKERAGTLPDNMSKAKVYAYIAAQEPSLRLGEAAKRGLWNFRQSAFDQLTAFLRML